MPKRNPLFWRAVGDLRGHVADVVHQQARGAYRGCAALTAFAVVSAGFQFRGSKSCRRETGVSAVRAMTSARHAWGSMSLSLAVPIKVYNAAARWPPRSEPAKSLDFRPRATPRRERSAALFDRQTRPSLRHRAKPGRARARGRKRSPHSQTAGPERPSGKGAAPQFPCLAFPWSGQPALPAPAQELDGVRSCGSLPPRRIIVTAPRARRAAELAFRFWRCVRPDRGVTLHLSKPFEVKRVAVVWAARREIHDQPAWQSGDSGPARHGAVLHGP